jgi:hypothetical protein
VRITFTVILLFVAISASAVSTNEEKYHCPLNASYLLNQLSAMEALPLYPSPEQVAPLQRHATRMAVEELKNKTLIPRESCDYFKISLYLMGLENGSDEFPKQFAAYNIADSRTIVRVRKMPQIDLRTL